VPDTEVDRIAPTLRPPGRPAMLQSWRHLAFLHWEVDVEALRRRVPAELEIDTFEERAFVGLVPFTMHGIRPPGFPALPGLSRFHEINVRTYVLRWRDPGVYFFSLDAASRLAVIGARTFWRLPYHFAAMDLTVEDDSVVYSSSRRWPGPRPADCRLRYRPRGPAAPARPGSLEHFLVERYLLFTVAGGRIWRGRVHHPPYPLQAAECPLLEERLLQAVGLDRPKGPPLVHYAAGVDVEVFPLEALTLAPGAPPLSV
jgi:uncharacterized protein YqjF (DUF2071 family)